jgi:membrane protein required for colicin V production
MNTLDLVLLALTAISGVWGLWRGLIRESFSVLAWLAGFPIASYFALDVRHWMNLSDTSPAVAYILAWVLVFISVWLVCRVFSSLLSGALSLVGLGVVNRLLGAVFGLMRAALALMVFVILVRLTPAANDTLWQSSWVVQLAHKGIEFFKPFLPVPLEGWVF